MLFISTEEMGEVVCSQCGLIINEKMIDQSHSDKPAYDFQFFLKIQNKLSFLNN